MIAAAAAVVAGACARCLRACLAAWLASCASLVRFVHTSCAAALAAARWSAGAAWFGASAVAVAAPVAAALAVAWAANEWLGVARSRARADEQKRRARRKPGHAVALPASPERSPPSPASPSPLRAARKVASRATGVRDFFGGKQRRSSSSKRLCFEDEAVQEALPAGPLRDLAHACDAPLVEAQLWPGDSLIAYCGRFLSQCHGDVAAALRGVERDLEWRKWKGPKDVVARGDDLARILGLSAGDVKRCLPLWVQGGDAVGRPFVIWQLGRSDLGRLFAKTTRPRVEWYMALHGEVVARACGAARAEAWSLLLDLRGLGWRHACCRHLVPWLADVYDRERHHNPERLAEITVVNAPDFVLRAYALAAPRLLDAATAPPEPPARRPPPAVKRRTRSFTAKTPSPEKPPDEKPKPAKRKSASFNFGRKHAFAPTEAPPPSPLADATPGRGTPPPTSRRIESTIHRDPADFATFESPPDGLQHRPLVDPLA
ncbi:hypothetical protein JL721_482 [Aureococcus anophagefferens]|nr:hypothetical protein JL721_482 [Aureococcus anophagefferens]